MDKINLSLKKEVPMATAQESRQGPAAGLSELKNDTQP